MQTKQTAPQFHPNANTTLTVDDKKTFVSEVTTAPDGRVVHVQSFTREQLQQRREMIVRALKAIDDALKLLDQ